MNPVSAREQKQIAERTDWLHVSHCDVSNYGDRQENLEKSLFL